MQAPYEKTATNTVSRRDAKVAAYDHQEGDV
ncbi:hypothetical protein SAMN04489717_5514 [Actinopolymorpha singaporensis]|uniref:Uncharacterized protein n=1 Tax=Actinopolymorpha singaporensis TaxID=117157 RepID=A0A1H1YIQ5_9ACTN|nr:hypothetical protein SAMN04489717_5514 [Actinopolymorpha singaporensis]